MSKGSTILVLATWAAIFSATVSAATMPVSQQNALVQKYCAVCHTDKVPNGLLSLEHFDAAHPDPGVAAMMVSKLKAKALGASGQKLPDRTIQDALLDALSAEAVGADSWIVDRTQDLSKSTAVTASIVQQVPASTSAGDPDLYRLTLTCHLDTHQAEIQLAWSPDVPHSGQSMYVAVDRNAPVTYKVEGNEKMGDGQAGTSGPGAAVLAPMPLPKNQLTVSNLFRNEIVVFPFGSLTQTARQSLSACFPGSTTGQ